MFVGFLYQIFVFVFGLLVGSFLNCLIYRMEIGAGFPWLRSYCPHCKKNLIWTDLFPIISFLYLRGRCRYCRKSISLQYPLVEIATGFVFLLVFNQTASSYQLTIGYLIELIFLFYILSSLIVIFVFDLKHFIIPDKVLFPAIAFALLYRLIGNFNLNIANYIIAPIIASGFFLIIYLISKGEWMGFGDVKLAILIGLLLGFPVIVLGMFLSFFFGAIMGLGLIILKLPLGKHGQLKLKSQIPFAPFLIAGAFIAMLWGREIMHWYTSFFVFAG